MVPHSLTLTLFSNHSSLRSSLVPRFLLSPVSRFLHAGTFVVLHSFLARLSCSCISLVSYFTLPLVVPCSYLARSLSYLDRTPFVSRSQPAGTSLVPQLYPCSYLTRTLLVSSSYLARSLSYLYRTSFVSRSQPALTTLLPRSYRFRISLIHSSLLDRTLLVSHSHLSRIFFGPRSYITCFSVALNYSRT